MYVVDENTRCCSCVKPPSLRSRISWGHSDTIVTKFFPIYYMELLNLFSHIYSHVAWNVLSYSVFIKMIMCLFYFILLIFRSWYSASKSNNLEGTILVSFYFLDRQYIYVPSKDVWVGKTNANSMGVSYIDAFHLLSIFQVWCP